MSAPSGRRSGRRTRRGAQRLPAARSGASSASSRHRKPPRRDSIPADGARCGFGRSIAGDFVSENLEGACAIHCHTDERRRELGNTSVSTGRIWERAELGVISGIRV
eukprot:6183323-Pleurochrysis_carterae.AAC.1